LLRSTRGLFVTMTYLVREAQSGELCYATGGHFPMLHRSGVTRDVEIRDGDEGLPLGTEKDSLLADRTIQLAAGDTLLLVTDGVVEALGTDRSVFQIDKRAEIFRKEGSGASQIGEDIFEEIGRISPAPPEDDLTALAVTWTPHGTGVRK
jgi:sigma-B regulation protein RsbU (phosphoserine phosphatase)